METRAKNLLLIFIGVLSLLLGGIGTGYADVSGPCSNCHTMHNSQGAAVMATDTTYGQGAYGALTKNTCLGCHTTTLLDPLDGNGYPYVQLGSGASNWLAGGYFTDGGLNHDDNSHTLTSTDTPAGYAFGGTFPEYSGGIDGLSCAGSAGCHGVQDIADQASAISGGHHGNNATLGYRMLCVGIDKVDGIGASDYEEALNLLPDDLDPHNLYNAGTTAANATISELCGKCHGDFHGTANTKDGSDWIRHPTDELIPADWEIQTDIVNYNAQDWKFNPAGTVNMAAPATGNLYVTCISCHRAHGSEYNDLLRFDYGAQSAGGAETTGCLGCHNKQRL